MALDSDPPNKNGLVKKSLSTQAEIENLPKMNTSERIRAKSPMEVWKTPNGVWIHEVYKHYHRSEKAELNNPYARVFCKVFSDHVGYGDNDPDLGDVYIREIVATSIKVFDEKIHGRTYVRVNKPVPVDGVMILPDGGTFMNITIQKQIRAQVDKWGSLPHSPFFG